MRKGNVLRFVNEVGLINKNRPVFSLSGADLHGANLQRSFLRDVNLRGADLTKGSPGVRAARLPELLSGGISA